MSISNIFTELDNQVTEHSPVHTRNSLIINESFNNSDLFVDEETELNEILNQSLSVERVVIQTISDMFDDTVITNFDKKLKEALIERETNKRYPDFLIKKYWTKNTECSYSSEDVILLLRHLRFLMKQTRSENMELSYIMTTLIKRRNTQFDKLFTQFQSTKDKLDTACDMLHKLEDILNANAISSDIDFNQFYTSLVEQDENVTNIDLDVVDVKLPISVPDIRQILEAEHSLLKNLLLPPITYHDSGNSYVMPSDILRLAICMGVEFEAVSGRTYNNKDARRRDLHKRSIYRCSVVRDLIGASDICDDVITVLYGFWSDGCYCGTESKGKRNQAKMTTIHIAHYSVTERHVFPIIFGKKGDNDDEVKETIIQDMIRLSNTTIPCYVPHLKRVCKIRFVLGYALQDRPEHAETTCFMGANGTFSRQVNMSCPISTTTEETHDEDSPPNTFCKQLKSCKRCWNKRVQFIQRRNYHEAARSRRCSDCYDWDLVSVEFYPHKEFPIDVLSATEVSAFNEGALKTKVITFDSMKRACRIIFDKVIRDEWTQVVAGHFARRECIRESVWKRIWKLARDARVENDIIDDIMLNESVFPPFWKQSLISLERFELGVMHYLFLNVGKHLFEIMSLKFSENGIWLNVFDVWNSQLLHVRKMCLSWCKGWTLGSKSVPGSLWVSENFVGFSILCKSLCSCIKTIPGRYAEIDNTHELLETYYTFVSTVMNPNEPTVLDHKYATALSKCFLSVVEEYCSGILRKSVNKIESTSCFVNLLKLGDKMKDCGIIRNYWEGGYRGEGIFRPLKDLVTRGLHTQKITAQVMKKQYQNLSINKLIHMKIEESSYISFLDTEMSDDTGEGDDHIPMNDDPNPLLTDNPDRFRRFHAYSNLEVVGMKLDDKVPVAVAYCVSKGKSYVFTGWKKKKKQMTELRFSNWSDIRHTSVFDVELSVELLSLHEVSRESSDYVSCLLLPLYSLVEEEDNQIVQAQYFMVSEDHKEMKSDGDFHTPYLYLNEKDVAEIGTGNATNNDRDVITQNIIDICVDRRKCEEFLDRLVEALPDLPYGKVASFKYRNRIVSVDTALWTVKYYSNEDGTGNARLSTVIGYFELNRILVDE